MSDETTAARVASGEAVTTEGAGRAVEEEQGRVFPCEECGADLRFDIGQQSLVCPYCGHVKKIPIEDGAQVAEQDFESMLARLVDQRRAKKSSGDDAGDPEKSRKEVRCESCGAEVVFVGTLTSTECPYCGSPVQLDSVREARDRVPIDGALPFQIERQDARGRVGRWIRSRWFAPNDFLRGGVPGKLQGVYLPYWTFDSLTFTRYRGERGEHYWVTVGTGKNRHQEMRTRWWPASGRFQRFFDDVLVVASRGLPGRVMQSLEPWPLRRCLPYRQEMLAGYLARTYDVDLPDGFVEARGRIDGALRQDVRSRIGGDEQRIFSIDTRYDAVTYKQLLLPVWLLAYRFRKKAYQVVVNAGTGEVQGQRPWSWVKILLAVVGALVAAGVAAAIFHGVR